MEGREMGSGRSNKTTCSRFTQRLVLVKREQLCCAWDIHQTWHHMLHSYLEQTTTNALTESAGQMRGKAQIALS